MNLLRKNVTLILRSANGLSLTRSLSKVTPILEDVSRTQQKQQTSYVQKSGLGTHVLGTEDDASVFKRLMKRVGWADNSRARIRVSSYILYESVADKINYQEFFHRFDLPNTFNSWFLVTELHVWMLMLRAMAEGSENGEDGRFMRNCIVEALWADVNTRAKKLGAHNPGGTRNQIHVLSQQFQASLIAYDEGMMSDDKTLAGALWRRFFERDCENFENLETLLRYVRKQNKILDSLSRKDFLIKPRIEWIQIKDF